MTRSPRSTSPSPSELGETKDIGSVSASSPESDENPGREEGTAERLQPVPYLHRTVATLTQLAEHFKRLRNRTGSSPPPESPSSTSET